MGKYTSSTAEVEMFGSKLTLKMELLETDYENFMIGYECYDNMKLTLEDDKLEPVHLINVGIATRDPNLAQEKIAEFEKIAIEKVPGFDKEDLATVLSGEAGHCKYQLTPI